MLNRASDSDGFFAMTYEMENGYEIWNMECHYWVGSLKTKK
jgi:hypothetical protein